MASTGAEDVPPPPTRAEVMGAVLRRWIPVRAVADTVIYLHYGLMWAACACFFPTILGRGSAVADAAAAFQLVSIVLGVLLSPVALNLFALRLAGSDTGTDSTEARKSPRQSKEVSHAPGGHHFAVVAAVLRRKAVMLAALICMWLFGMLASVGSLMDGGSHEKGRAGGLLLDVGTLYGSAILVVIVYPNLAMKAWEVTRRDKLSSSLCASGMCGFLG